ncbi:23S rRNA (adenine(1618)-N(6))-methyltransferase RlmF [Vibrio sp.]|uniref:23S rRNA (adenine(1618)-N(6))-methyltransferase RlmF n=1 Tax=Vibrio sp. TaxID=678 RepID=UPI003AA9D9AF
MATGPYNKNNRHSQTTNRSNKSSTQKPKSNKPQANNKTASYRSKSLIQKKPIGLHPRNLHHGRYDFDKLESANPALTEFVILNPRGERSISFSDPKAVLALNEGLLKAYYGLEFWQIPPGYLCPPIPGRADYIHYLADLLSATKEKTDVLIVENDERDPNAGSANHKHTVLDIGTGANCIYPILGSSLYDWNFVASDIDPISVKTAQLLIQANKRLTNKVKVRQQSKPSSIFYGIIKPNDDFILTMCNPPFHESLEKAREGNLRKINNLNKGKTVPLSKNNQPVLNFAGTESELCYEGGEIAFLKQMAIESKDFAKQVCWFTSLVSKKENVPLLQQQLKKLGATNIRVVEMAQGQKISRFVAWSFLTNLEQKSFFN